LHQGYDQLRGWAQTIHEAICRLHQGDYSSLFGFPGLKISLEEALNLKQMKPQECEVVRRFLDAMRTFIFPLKFSRKTYKEITKVTVEL
jgi:hypothetical protein